MGSYITDVTAAQGMGIKQSTTKAKTGMTRCGKNHDKKNLKKKFLINVNRIINGNTSNSFSQKK
jgi:hypothetical protein